MRVLKDDAFLEGDSRSFIERAHFLAWEKSWTVRGPSAHVISSVETWKWVMERHFNKPLLPLKAHERFWPTTITSTSHFRVHRSLA